MTKPYQHPVPDFSTALPPKNGVGLSLSSAAVLAVLKRHIDRPFTATMVLQAMKEDFNIWDNHVTALGVLSRLAAHDKIWPAPHVEAGGRPWAAWSVQLPRDFEEGEPPPMAATRLPAGPDRP